MSRQKKKAKEDSPAQKYLPLEISKRYSTYQKVYKDLVGAELDVDALNILYPVFGVVNEKEIQALFEADPSAKKKVDGIIKFLRRNSSILLNEFTGEQAVLSDILYPAVPILRWQEYKQALEFDGDFLNNLLETDAPKFRKDFWKYVPFTDMFLDFRRCEEFQKEMHGLTGMFVSLRLRTNTDNSEYWEIQCTAVNNHMDVHHFKSGYKNSDFDVVFDHDEYEMNVNETEGWEGELLSKIEKVLFQTISYLATEKPDIRESEMTKRTYKPRYKDAKPKDKMSEVRKWEIGFRYGSAFRKWEEEQKKSDTSLPSGKTVRPHFRRAHWHTYHGKLKWQDVIAVKMGDLDKSKIPAVIHKTKKEKQKEIER